MNKRIITINRMYGSNGRIIGKALANEMGIGFYDRELIEMASNKEKMFLSISLQKLMKSVRARGDFQLTTNFRLGSIATLFR